MREIMRWAISCLVAGIFCASACADSVLLKNGDRISGTIDKSDTENLVIKSDYAGAITIKWSAIDKISASQPVYVTSQAGQVITGTVETEGGKLNVTTKDLGVVSVSKDDVRAIRSQQEQASYQSWNGFLDTGLSLARGNSESTTYTLGANATRTTEKDKTAAYLTYLTSSGRTNGITLTTAKSVRGGLRYDFNLGPRSFAFAFTDLEHDPFQLLNLRNVIGGGAGLHARKTDFTTLDLYAGGAFDQEFFTNNISRRSGELLLGEELTHKISGSTSLRERLDLFPNVSDVGQFRMVFDTSAVTKLTKVLDFQVTLSDRYQSNPLPNIKTNDLLLTTGLRFSFGVKGQ